MVVTATEPMALLRHLVGWGLSTGPGGPLDSPDATALPVVAEFHRVTGVVLDAIDAGAIGEVGDGVVRDLQDRHRRLLQQSLRAEADLVVVARALQAAGVEFRVLKGCATAHLDVADPALRLTSDVDVLVRSHELGRACDVLQPLVDEAATVPDRRVAWTERYGKDRTLKLVSGGWLDLHRLLVPGYFGLVDTHPWFAGGDSFVVAGERLVGLGTDDRFLHAALHAGGSAAMRAHSVRDVPVILDEIGDRWRDVVDQSAPLRSLTARGIVRTWEFLALRHHPIVDWAREVRPGVRERFALTVYDLPGARHHWSGVAALPPWKWSGLIVPIVVPDERYLRHYGRSRAQHVRGTATRLRRRRDD